MAVRGGPPQEQVDERGCVAPNDGLEYQLEREKNGVSLWKCVSCKVFATGARVQSKRHVERVRWHAEHLAGANPWTGMQDPSLQPALHTKSKAAAKSKAGAAKIQPEVSVWGRPSFSWSETIIDTTKTQCHPSAEQIADLLWYTPEAMPKKLKLMERGFTYKERTRMEIQDRDSKLMNQISRMASQPTVSQVVEKVVEIVVEKKVIEERIVEVMVEGVTPSRPQPKFKAGQSVHQWWAYWMPGAQTAPATIGGKKGRPAWYSASITSPAQWATTVYGGATLTGWGYRVY